MSKPITSEMIEAMSLDQLKTLQNNAHALDTPAAHHVLDLLEQSGLLKPRAVARAKPAPKRPAVRKPRATAAAKPVRATHGRQS